MKKIREWRQEKKGSSALIELLATVEFIMKISTKEREKEYYLTAFHLLFLR